MWNYFRCSLYFWWFNTQTKNTNEKDKQALARMHPHLLKYLTVALPFFCISIQCQSKIFQRAIHQVARRLYLFGRQTTKAVWITTTLCPTPPPPPPPPPSFWRANAPTNRKKQKINLKKLANASGIRFDDQNFDRNRKVCDAIETNMGEVSHFMLCAFFLLFLSHTTTLELQFNANSCANKFYFP